MVQRLLALLAPFLLAVLMLAWSADSRAAQLECVVAAGGCDEVLLPVGDNQIRVENRTDLAGKTLCIPAGTYHNVSISDVIAEEANPATFINCGGQVILDATGWSTGISVLRSQYLRITGTGDGTHTYGIVQKNANSMGLNADLGTSDIEIDHLEVFNNGYAGIVVRTYPRCFNKYNRATWSLRRVSLHDNYVHDVAGEGFYVGTSHFHQGEMEVDQFDYANSCPGEMAAQAELRHIRIYNNIVNRTGLDGIQLGAAVEDAAVYGNHITSYATEQAYGHVGSLQLNSGTTGQFYNNWIESSPEDQSGTAIQYTGGVGGPTEIYNNVIIGSPTAILTLGRMGSSDTPLRIVHNTIVNSGSPYFFFCHSGDFIMEHTIKNNIFAGYEHIGDNYWDDWSKIFNSDSENCPINGQVYPPSNAPDAFIFISNSYAQNLETMEFYHPFTNDYHLLSHSPARSAGEDFLSMAPTDFDAVLRQLPPDNGAYTFVTGTFSLADVILGLQVLASMDVQHHMPSLPERGNDNKLGLAEIIYVLAELGSN